MTAGGAQTWAASRRADLARAARPSPVERQCPRVLRYVLQHPERTFSFETFLETESR